MKLLQTQPISRDPDDGVRAEYECQACLAVAVYAQDAYDTPEHITCFMCGWNEEKDES